MFSGEIRLISEPKKYLALGSAPFFSSISAHSLWPFLMASLNGSSANVALGGLPNACANRTEENSQWQHYSFRLLWLIIGVTFVCLWLRFHCFWRQLHQTVGTYLFYRPFDSSKSVLTLFSLLKDYSKQSYFKSVAFDRNIFSHLILEIIYKTEAKVNFWVYKTLYTMIWWLGCEIWKVTELLWVMHWINKNLNKNNQWKCNR